jgi:hypothetical protein
MFWWLASLVACAIFFHFEGKYGFIVVVKALISLGKWKA